jgi:hypothetical protein
MGGVCDGGEPAQQERPVAAEDLEECGAVGERYGLGTVEAVRRDLDDSNGYSITGGCFVTLGLLGLCVAVPVIGGVTSSGANALTAGEICGALLVVGGIALVIGRRHASVMVRLCLYSGGLARLDHRKPEPEVLPWADVGPLEAVRQVEVVPVLHRLKQAGTRVRDGRLSMT